MKLVRQETMMGCSVACVASILNTSYSAALELFTKGNKHHHLRGFYNRDIIKALSEIGKEYESYKVKNYNYSSGDIVFARNKKYGSGHYLLKTENGWMDPWVNYPDIKIKSGYRKRLPGKPQWKITEVR